MIEQERAWQQKIAPHSADSVCVTKVIKRNSLIILIADPPSIFGVAARTLKAGKSIRSHLVVVEDMSARS